MQPGDSVLDLGTGRGAVLLPAAFSRSWDPRWAWYEELLRDSGALEGLPGPSGYPRIRQPGILRGLLEHADFTDVVERDEPTDLWYASPEAWWASLWTHGSRRPLERMSGTH